MKKFNLQIESDNVRDVILGLRHAANCIEECPQIYERMAVDGSDEMMDADPKVVFYRSE